VEKGGLRLNSAVEVGGAKRIRTADLLRAREALLRFGQLSIHANSTGAVYS
jgi:hypothetical protein